MNNIQNRVLQSTKFPTRAQNPIEYPIFNNQTDSKILSHNFSNFKFKIAIFLTVVLFFMIYFTLKSSSSHRLIEKNEKIKLENKIRACPGQEFYYIDELIIEECSVNEFFKIFSYSDSNANLLFKVKVFIKKDNLDIQNQKKKKKISNKSYMVTGISFDSEYLLDPSMIYHFVLSSENEIKNS